MPTLPNSNPEALAWLQERIADWIEVAATIGLSPAQAAALQAQINTTQIAVDASSAARIASKDATVVKVSEYRSMRTDASGAIQTIKAFASSSPDPAAVYAAAHIPPPTVPVSAPPQTPFDIRFDLRPQGDLQLKWSGSSNGGSAVYIISRSVQLDPSQSPSPMAVVGYSGERSFVDPSVPACTVAATYAIKAIKGQHVTPDSTPAMARFVPASATDPGDLVLAA